MNIKTIGQESCITCQVKVERLSLPEYEVSSSARAYEIFSRSTENLQNLRLRPEQRGQMRWLEMENDNALAWLILGRIKQRIDAAKVEGRSHTGSKK